MTNLEITESDIVVAPDHDAKELDRILDLETITLKLPKEVIDLYKEIANDNEVILPVFLRFVLTSYLKYYSDEC